MPISRSVPRDDDRKKEKEAFIDGGGYVKEDIKKKSDFTNILLRVPNSCLERIQERLDKKQWMNRTQWIMEAIEAKLNENS